MEVKVVESGFVRVARKSELPIGKMKVVTVDGKEVLIANVNGTYYAIGNKCTHANVDLSRGSLEGNVVTCPKHAAKFDVTNGRVVAPPKVRLVHPKIRDEPSYQVKVVNENIMLKL
jgi:3-phenylpropionate/trans-cinnamate dioxygenase ferredoxin subunit